MRTNPPVSQKIHEADLEIVDAFVAAVHRSRQLAEEMGHIRWVSTSWGDATPRGLASAVVSCTNLRSLKVIDLSRRAQMLDDFADTLSNDSLARVIWTRLDTLLLLRSSDAAPIRVESLRAILSAVGQITGAFVNVGSDLQAVAATTLAGLTSLTSLRGSLGILEDMILQYDQLTDNQAPRRRRLCQIDLQGSTASAYQRTVVEQLNQLPVPHPFLATVRILKIPFYSIPTNFGVVIRHLTGLRKVDMPWELVPDLHLFDDAARALRHLKVCGTSSEPVKMVLQLMEYLEHDPTDATPRLKRLRAIEIQISARHDAALLDQTDGLSSAKARMLTWCRARRISFKWE
ncbi:hypothetical protein BKA62DRAFT_671243 [Auriculariales sp. MPI-PUGE-AT-0066]|nr:hypothetical protein BKA62DRAFT_671243 [Auriculariales sp. MPI-PUGE-AT-0066]